jgi:hypothetical protein
MQNEYEAEIDRLNEERRLAAERINELLAYKDIVNRLNICAKDGYLWALSSVQSDFEEVTQVSLVCTRSGSIAVIDLNDRPVKVSHVDLDGKPIPIEIIDAARNN